jgi:hypothetical protein
MVQKTFVLKRKKTFRRGVIVFVKDIYGKLSPRVLKFSTEHLVPVKLRKTRARTMPAEYTTSNPDEIEALFCDLSYGKDFYLEGDSEGKLKQAARIVSKMDSEKMALKGLFEMINLPFDESKPLAVLEQMYRIHGSALSGRKIEKVSAPAPIPIEKVDVAAEMAKTAEAARNIYVDKYNKPVPEEVINDLGFLSALGDPDFDAEKYIANLGGEDAPEVIDNNSGEDTRTIQQLQNAFFEKKKTNVPNNKKNDAAWIKNKLAE